MKKNVIFNIVFFILLFSYCSKKSPIEQEAPTVTGNDGRTYKIIKIGEQVWMAENLRETKYQNGDSIPNITDDTQWDTLTTGAFCAYGNDESNADTYGYFYNREAVGDKRNIAPKGWHIPTDEDWKQLEMALGMSRSEADKDLYRGTNEGSKLAGNASLWWDDDLKNNSEFGTSGFSALPGGICSLSGKFFSMGENAYYWSSKEPGPEDRWWYRFLNYKHEQLLRLHGSSPSAFSVRCVKD